jgi:hypothetical protein
VIASQICSGLARMNTWYTCVVWISVIVVMRFPPVRA